MGCLLVLLLLAAFVLAGAGFAVHLLWIFAAVFFILLGGRLRVRTRAEPGRSALSALTGRSAAGQPPHRGGAGEESQGRAYSALVAHGAGFGSLGTAFSPSWTCGAVWSARRPVKPEVAGSNPVRSAHLAEFSARRHDGPAKVTCSLHGRVAQSAERAPEKREVTGSTPVPTTNETPNCRCTVFWSVAPV